MTKHNTRRAASGTQDVIGRTPATPPSEALNGFV